MIHGNKNIFGSVLRIASIYLAICCIFNTQIFPTTPAFAADSRVTVTAVDEPPNSFIDSSGHLTGISIDFVNEIMKRVGQQTEISVYPTARTIQHLFTQPNFVSLSIARTREREDKLYWISMVVQKPWVLYSLRSNNLNLTSFKEASLFGKIGVQRRGIRQKQLYNLGFKNVDPANSHEQNIRKLLAGRIDFVYADAGAFSIESSQLHINQRSFNKFKTPYSSSSYIAMSKTGTPPELAEKWIKAAREIKKDGTFDRICRKWQKKYLNYYGMESKVVPGKYLEIM